MKERKKKRKIGKKLLVAFLVLVIFAASALGIMELGVWYTATHWDYFTPTYAKVDIQPLLYKSERTDEDYETIYRQTGLTRIGVDGLLEKGKHSKILDLQTAFFKKYELSVEHFAAFTYIESINGRIPLAELQDGDILVTATTRVSWFRYGHAAIVIDAKNMLIAEAVAVGEDSWIASAYSFEDLADFIVLRPKVDENIRKQAAKFAKENLIGLPYRLTTGILSAKYQKEIKGSQCAHLVWYAYKTFGIDLDSTGGAVVKPQDIANSEHVEVVQAFGFDLDELWS